MGVHFWNRKWCLYVQVHRWRKTIFQMMQIHCKIECQMNLKATLCRRQMVNLQSLGKTGIQFSRMQWKEMSVVHDLGPMLPNTCFLVSLWFFLSPHLPSLSLRLVFFIGAIWQPTVTVGFFSQWELYQEVKGQDFLLSTLCCSCSKVSCEVQCESLWADFCGRVEDSEKDHFRFVVEVLNSSVGLFIVKLVNLRFFCWFFFS